MITAKDAKNLTQKGVEANHIAVIEQMIKSKANIGQTTVRVPGFWITAEVKECLTANGFKFELLENQQIGDYSVSW